MPRVALEQNHFLFPLKNHQFTPSKYWILKAIWKILLLSIISYSWYALWGKETTLKVFLGLSYTLLVLFKTASKWRAWQFLS